MLAAMRPGPASALTALSAALVLLSVGCGSEAPPLECVAVDPDLGDPAKRVWCDGEYSPTMTWKGQSPVTARAMCLAPEADGSCEVCPVDEVTGEVATRLDQWIADNRPECALEHWELGCMRTIEHAQIFVEDGDHCCFQVAMWGPGCEEDFQ